MTSRTEPRHLSIDLNHRASCSPRRVSPLQALTFHREIRSPYEFEERTKTRACGQRAAMNLSPVPEQPSAPPSDATGHVIVEGGEKSHRQAKRHPRANLRPRH